jgi:hypothetical protein
MRVALAFLLAPLVPTILAIPVNYFLSAQNITLPPDSFARGVLFTSTFSFVFALPAALVLAVPLYFWFRRQGWLKLRHALVAGLAVGALVTLLFTIYAAATTQNFITKSDDNLYVHWRTVKEGLSYGVLFLPYGVLTAWVWWVVAYWRKPNL